MYIGTWYHRMFTPFYPLLPYNQSTNQRNNFVKDYNLSGLKTVRMAELRQKPRYAQHIEVVLIQTIYKQILYNRYLAYYMIEGSLVHY